MKDYTEVIPISVKITAAQKRKLDELCDEFGYSQSELVRAAITALIKEHYGRGTEDALAKTMDEGVA
jgi:Arc/MetJ-type ribon-helix-helix transcriptional regulator